MEAGSLPHNAGWRPALSGAVRGGGAGPVPAGRRVRSGGHGRQSPAAPGRATAPRRRPPPPSPLPLSLPLPLPAPGGGGGRGAGGGGRGLRAAAAGPGEGAAERLEGPSRRHRAAGQGHPGGGHAERHRAAVLLLGE